jgi:mediator of DNA damage checkpoint protein 1
MSKVLPAIFYCILPQVRVLIQPFSFRTQYFSPDPAKLFSGCCISTDHLPIGDDEVIRAAIQALGGQFRQGLTRDVSHLIVLSPEGDKYHTAVQFGKAAGMKVVLPHWFDDSFKAQHLMDTTPYEFPEPPLLKPHLQGISLEGPALSKEKKTLLRAIELAESGSSKRLKEDLKANVWQGRKILLSATLALEAGRRGTVEDLIKRTGGIVVRAELEEDAVEEVDVLVTRYREGSAYLRALQLHKTIGTLAWLFHVEYSGSFVSPTKNLLHFPVRPQKIPEMVGKVRFRSDTLHERLISVQKITISNYTGETREYLKVLITHMGAEFSKEMKRSDTFVVVACSKTPKTEKAHEWGVEIVNHLWLEDCYTEWRMAPFTNSRYTHSFPSDQLQLALVSRGVENITFESELKELGLSPSKAGKKSANRREQRSPGEILADVKNYKHTDTLSVQEQEEVEAVVGGMDLDMAMDGDISGPDVSTPTIRHDTGDAQASSPTKATAKCHQQPVEAAESNAQPASPSKPTRQPYPVEEPVSDGLSPAPVPKKRRKISLEGKNAAPAFTNKPQSKSRRYDPADEEDGLLSLDQLRSIARSGKPTREGRPDADKPVKIKALGKLKEQVQSAEKEAAKNKKRVEDEEDETDVAASPVSEPTKPPKPAPRSKQVAHLAEADDSHSRPATKAAVKGKAPSNEAQTDDFSGNNHEYWYSEQTAKPPKSKEERQKEREALELDGGRLKRGAANRAASKLKSDMEDRNRFEKEIKHGQVMGSWEGKRALYKRGRDPELEEVLDRRPPKKRKSMPESGEDSIVEGSVIFKQ